jgi:hypothetical protein
VQQHQVHLLDVRTDIAGYRHDMVRVCALQPIPAAQRYRGRIFFFRRLEASQHVLGFAARRYPDHGVAAGRERLYLALE